MRADAVTCSSSRSSRRRSCGVTDDTDVDVQRSAALVQAVAAFALPSVDAVVSLVEQLAWRVAQHVAAPTQQQQQSSSSSSSHVGCWVKVCLFGSSALGAAVRGSDIDLYALLRVSGEASSVVVIAARVPLIKFVYRHDVSVDVVCAAVALAAPPTAAQLRDDALLQLVALESRASVSGVRTVLELQQCVSLPHTVYACVLRAVKWWAMARGVYGNLYTYPNGVALAVLVARACQLYAHLQQQQQPQQPQPQSCSSNHASNSEDAAAVAYLVRQSARLCCRGGCVATTATSSSCAHDALPARLFVFFFCFCHVLLLLPSSSSDDACEHDDDDKNNNTDGQTTSPLLPVYVIAPLLRRAARPRVAGLPPSWHSARAACRQELLPVINPAYPYTNACHTVGRCGLLHFRREVARAHALLCGADAHAACPSPLSVSSSSLPLSQLWSPYVPSCEYAHVAVVHVSCACALRESCDVAFELWRGYVESRLRFLVYMLECVLDVRPCPCAHDIAHAHDATRQASCSSSSSSNNNSSNNNTNEHASPSSPLRDGVVDAADAPCVREAVYAFALRSRAAAPYTTTTAAAAAVTSTRHAHDNDVSVARVRACFVEWLDVLQQGCEPHAAQPFARDDAVMRTPWLTMHTSTDVSLPLPLRRAHSS